MKNHSRTKTPLEGSVDQFCPGSLAPTLDKNHDYEAHDYDYHYRRSVLSKVKDKAMIWKRITRRNSYNDASTPEWGVSLQDEFDEDEDPDQFLGHPRHGPEEQSKTIKEGASRPKWRSIPEIYQRHVLEDRARKLNEQEEDKEVPIKTLTRSVTRTLTAPACAVASGAQMIASMLQDVVVSGTSVASAAWEGTSSSLHQIIEKGSTVSKGKVVEKGEQEENKVCDDETMKRAAMAKKTPNVESDTGVREKVREAVSSIIENELGLSAHVSTTTNNQQMSGDEELQSQRILQTN